jgi:hypothetical protein
MIITERLRHLMWSRKWQNLSPPTHPPTLMETYIDQALYTYCTHRHTPCSTSSNFIQFKLHRWMKKCNRLVTKKIFVRCHWLANKPHHPATTKFHGYIHLWVFTLSIKSQKSFFFWGKNKIRCYLINQKPKINKNSEEKIGVTSSIKSQK